MIDHEILYMHAPVVLQNLLLSGAGFRLNRRRYGGNYQELVQRAERQGALDKDGLSSVQCDRLRAHFRAAATPPFWKRRFAEYGAQVSSSNPFGELAKLPIVTKAEVKDYASQILNSAVPCRDLVECHTSGTTGSGLVFRETRSAEQERYAVWWRYRNQFGLTRETWHGYFGGRTIVSPRQQKPPYWRTNWPGRQVLFSAYHLREDTAALYVDAIRRARLEWLHGYPSQLAVLAEWIRTLRLPRIETLRIITTGAENLLDQQRRLITEVFGVPVHQHYGLAECVANFSECREGQSHVDEDYAFVEFVPVEGGGDLYRIVGTNWSNPAFPLLRYDTGDLARLSAESCPCGNPGRVVTSVDGRQEDVVVLPNGSQVGRLDHLFKDMVHIREAQIYQPDRESLVFRIVKGSGYKEREDEAQLLGEARQRLGDEIGVRFEYWESIPKTKSGKLRFVVSDLKAKAESMVGRAQKPVLEA